MTIKSVLELEFLLHCRTVCGPFRLTSQTSGDVMDNITRRLQSKNLIARVPPEASCPGWEWSTTTRGRVHVENLLKLKLPYHGDYGHSAAYAELEKRIAKLEAAAVSPAQTVVPSEVRCAC